MSSGERFLKRKAEYTEIAINRQTLTDIVGSWLYATRMVDDAKNIKEIHIIDGNISENVYLQIHTNGGATN